MARPTKRAKLDGEGFVVPANEVVVFHIADPESKGDLADLVEPFQPDMAHQVFGDEEQIAGYSDLQVDVWLDPNTFKAYLEVHFSEKQEPADDIEASLREWFGEDGITTDGAAFRASLAASQPLAAAELGQLRYSTGQAGAAGAAAVEVYHSQLASAPARLKALHAALQPLLVFYIDAASYLDATDPDWQLLLAVQQHKERTIVVGLCAVYRCYRYPSGCRLRLSQLLVLPPFQRQGVGRALLRAAYSVAQELGARDVTFEDPTEQLQALRHDLDLQLLMQNKDITAAAARAAAAVADSMPPPGAGSAAAQRQANPLALPAAALAAAQADTRLAAKQVRYVWEAVLYLQPQLRSGKGLAALKKLIRARAQGGGATAQRDAQGKQFCDTGKDSWIMARGRGGPSAVSLSAVEAQEAEQQEAAVATFVADRLQQLQEMAAAADAAKENVTAA